MTSSPALVSLLLAAAALWLWPAAAPVRRPTSRSAAARRTLPPWIRRAVTAGAGALSIAVLAQWPWWVVLLCAGGGALLGRTAARRRPPPDPRALRAIAIALDSVAACLHAGMPVPAAIDAVLDGSGADGPAATGGASSASTRAADLHTASAANPASTRDAGGITAGTSSPTPDVPGSTPDGRIEAFDALRDVAALLALGADAATAWQPAAQCRELTAFALAAQRSTTGGVRLADAAAGAAAELRTECRERARARAARAGVAMTGPLTLCFLPAFVVVGLAPVVIGLVSSLSIW